ncbi:MAG TPA: AcrB/AcrD/AcrF family protein, partial [Bacteroidetes bacterium]|nr:AcrB/AcrD/AcrF family protein [Bacteroidota bacterium]
LKEKIKTANLPNGTFVVYTGDNSEFVRNLVEELQNNLVAGIFFVVMALVFFLGIRASMLVAISIPLSMLMSFAVFQVMGLTLNFIVLFSLIIALGLLADNAIVVVENIYRFREMGYEKFEAARLATREVTGPVIYATLTTLAAFFPMLFWPGVIGKFMSYLPLTLIITLSTSLFVALVMNPVITAYLVRLDNEPKAIPPKWINYVTYIAIASLTILMLIINWVTVPVLIGLSLVLFAFTRYFLVPVSDFIINKQFPRYLVKYKEWLELMMQRDYQVRYALLRNTFTLTSFTLGFILLIVGSLLSIGEPAYGGFTLAQVVFMLPAGVIFTIGVLGIFFHTFEVMIRGGKATIALSWKTAIAMLVVFLIAWFRTDFEKPDASVQLLRTALSLSVAPILMLIFGIIGLIFKSGRPLILTDNRAIVLNLTFGLFFGIFMVYAIAPTGVAFFPSTDPRQVTVNLQGGIGTNVQTSNKMAQKAETKIERLIGNDPLVAENIKNYQTGVGTAGGQESFFGGGGSPQNSFVTINMVDYGDRGESSKNTLTKLRDVVRSIPGALLKFTAPSNGPPTGAPVNIEVSGPDFNEIVRISHDLKFKLSRAAEKKQIDGLVDVRDNLNSGRPEVRVKIDRERAQQYKLSTGQIASTIRSAINGTEASKFRDGEDEYDITVRLRPEDRNALESIQNLTLPVNVGGNPNNRRQLPLSAVATLEVGAGLGSITRLDGRRVVTVSGDAAPGYSGPEVLGKVTAFLADYKVKKGYVLNFTGENKDQQESFGFLSIALFMGIALIFLLLVMEFRNIRGPLVIMIGMGLSLIGVMLGLILTRSPFGLMTFIALISLSGLVVNHTIVLIDFALKREEEGETSLEAIIEAG